MDAATIKLNPRLLVDSQGETRDVVLSLAEFRELMELIEDHVDAQDLDKAIRTAGGFTPLEDVLTRAGTGTGPYGS